MRTVLLVCAGTFRGSNFLAILAGFSLQTVFLAVRGNALGRCPLTNLFEVFIFMAWSVALIYILVGPAYRLSLMGAFTAPLVLLIQSFALLAPIDGPRAAKIEVNPWLEFHASMSIVAYGAFALACIAGLMYLLQERQLKTHRLHSVFQNLPPLANLYAAITRLLWLGFCLYTAGLVSGFFTGEPLPRFKMMCAIAVWCFYGAILQGRHLFRLAPRHVAVLCIVAFSAAVSVLWGITFVAQRAPA
ncbi:MAG: inner membrane protein YpjD [Chthoniobacterales bacterium]